MFSSFGWVEFFTLLILGLIIIGPERLPGVIEDVRAAIYAARKGIANAKRELNGELEGFEEFRAPLNTVTKYAAMGPTRAVSSILFDGDEEYLESFDPRRALDADPARAAGATAGAGAAAAARDPQVPSGPRGAAPAAPAGPAGPAGPAAQPPATQAPAPAESQQPHSPQPSQQPQQPLPQKRAASFSWEDVV